MCTKWPFLVIFAIFGRFWPFLAVFGRFWPFLKKKKCFKSCHLPVFHGTLQGQLSTMQKECRNMLKMAIFGDFGLFLAIFGRFWPFLTNKNVENHVIYLSFMAHYWGNLSLCKKSAKMCTKLPFLVILAIFWPFWPFFCHFWAVLGRF